MARRVSAVETIPIVACAQSHPPNLTSYYQSLQDFMLFVHARLLRKCVLRDIFQASYSTG